MNSYGVNVRMYESNFVHKEQLKLRVDEMQKLGIDSPDLFYVICYLLTKDESSDLMKLFLTVQIVKLCPNKSLCLVESVCVDNK